MSQPFSRARDGSIRVRLTEREADVIRGVAAEVSGVVEERAADLQRLFPPAYPDDVRRQSEFAEMTHDDLARAKREAAEAVVSSLDGGDRRRGRVECVLGDDAAHGWLGLLNDARLVLGTRLGVEQDLDHTPRAPDDPEGAAFNLYLYLGAIQEALLDELAAGIEDTPDRRERSDDGD